MRKEVDAEACDGWHRVLARSAANREWLRFAGGFARGTFLQ